MEQIHETSRFLRETGYPDTIFLQWGITLDESNRKEARQDLEKILAGLPSLERNILELRYQQFLTIDQIAAKLGVPHHIVRKRKGETIRRLMYTKAGLNLYQMYHNAQDTSCSFNK